MSRPQFSASAGVNGAVLIAVNKAFARWFIQFVEDATVCSEPGHVGHALAERLQEVLGDEGVPPPARNKPPPVPAPKKTATRPVVRPAPRPPRKEGP